MTKIFVFIFLLSGGFISNYCNAQNAKTAPKLIIGDITADSTSYEEFLSKPKLNCILNNCEVTSFTFNILYKTGTRDDMVTADLRGSEIPQELRDKITELKSKKQKCAIIIESVRVKYNGTDMALKPGWLKYYLR